MTKLLCVFAFCLLPFSAMAELMTSPRPLPRPETVAYVFGNGEDSATITVDNRGGSEVTEEFARNYRTGFLVDVTPTEIEAGGVFPYYSFNAEMTGEAKETVEFFKDERGHLHIWFLGAIALPLVTEERFTTLGPQVP